MTLLDFINTYDSCAINYIPRPEAESVLDMVQTAQYAAGRVDNLRDDVRRDQDGHIGFRFQNGMLVNFKRHGEYREGDPQFHLKAIISYSELVDEPNEEADLSSVFELC